MLYDAKGKPMYGEGVNAQTPGNAQEQQLRQWHQAPWWARMFGFTWRRMLHDGSAYTGDGPTYQYQTTRTRARDALEKTYNDPYMQMAAAARQQGERKR